MYGMNGWNKEIPGVDLISRAAAIDDLHGKDPSQIWDTADIEVWVNALPSAQPDTGYSDGYADGYKQGLKDAQPERMRGKWIERNPRNSPDCRLIECSECGNAYIVGYNINYDDWIDGRNFCMKCGADLRGGSNGKNT